MSARQGPLAEDRPRTRGGERATPGSAWRVGPRVVLPPLLVVAATCATYAGLLRNGFVDWDDQIAIVTNPHIRALSIENIRWMFTTFHLGPYQPLAWLSIGLDHAMWGLNPIGYHLTSGAFHVANALLVYLLAMAFFEIAARGAASDGGRAPNPADVSHAALGGPDRWCAALAALLFSLHPLRVESVAWATERRDVLCGFFCLIAVLLYVRRFARAGVDAGASDEALAGTGSRGAPFAALACFVLALSAKASAMTLPMVLLALDVYPLGRLSVRRGEWRSPAQRRVLVEKVPFVAAAAAAALVAILGQSEAGAIRGWGEAGALERVRLAVFGAAFYVQKTAAPFALSPLYEAATYGRGAAAVAVRASLVAGLVWLAWALRRRAPAFSVACVCYFWLLAPVSGLVSVGSHAAADRYTYLPCIGWAIAAAAGARAAVRRGAKSPSGGDAAGRGARTGFRVAASVLSCGVVAALGALTMRQIPVWRDSLALWAHAARIDPRSAIAQYGLGFALWRSGNAADAIEQYRRAIALKPDYVDARVNLGTLLAEGGDLDAARAQFEAAAEAAPNDATVHYNLGLVAARQGRVDSAVAGYQRALALRPTLTSARINLAELLAANGDRHHARQILTDGIALSPGDSLLTHALSALGE